MQISTNWMCNVIKNVNKRNSSFASLCWNRDNKLISRINFLINTLLVLYIRNFTNIHILKNIKKYSFCFTLLSHKLIFTAENVKCKLKLNILNFCNTNYHNDDVSIIISFFVCLFFQINSLSNNFNNKFELLVREQRIIYLLIVRTFISHEYQHKRIV